MARASTHDDVSALRADIAELTKSIARIEAEMDATRAAAKNGAHAAHHNGNALHDVAEDVMGGAVKLGENAAGVAGEAAHAGAAWLDDMLRKNPAPAVLTALGVGFLLGVIGRR